MDAAVKYELVEGKAGDFSSDGIEARKKDGVRSVVYNNFNSSSGFEGPDIASFASDYAALYLVILDREGCDGILDGGLGRGPLDGVDHNPLGFFRCIETSFVDSVIDVSLSFRTGFSLHCLDKLSLSLLGCHAGNVFKLLVDF